MVFENAGTAPVSLCLAKRKTHMEVGAKREQLEPEHIMSTEKFCAFRVVVGLPGRCAISLPAKPQAVLTAVARLLPDMLFPFPDLKDATPR
ncbi:hypothetical protein BAUCODRAFT_376688 [Baudoinia panamericana UAMH 10762]|uniref:Uncharacterized protein n=1 Tax=Baudoinia panamericana (strain UAMH 10762) TaxID=717646 RepID=M2N3T0_BAUPA|nr:uncharacterized protein BAUCODRAFT_376688 [Baudoinia panamericana UAMH 10762]EMC98638.1 hypothetical protein BAUCODRAFT_376688 [Baudoinia panamericana UAMH 10762]